MRPRSSDTSRAVSHTQGGWAGECPVPGCTVWLQGRDRSIVDAHLAVVHEGVLQADPHLTTETEIHNG